MASEVCAALGLTGARADLSGKLVAIAERRGGDAGFVTGSLVWNALRDEGALCLLALRDNFAHHRGVAKKLGHDLKSAVDAGRAVVLERETGDFAAIDMGVEDNLKRVFLDVKRTLDSFTGKRCLVIDDLSELLCLGAPVAMVVTFVQYCRSLQRADPQLALVVRSHVFDEDEEQRVLANFLAHVATVRATVAGLRTGFSANVTGSIEVEEFDRKSVVANARLLHYKATDRQVKVFAPGTVGVRY